MISNYFLFFSDVIVMERAFLMFSRLFIVSIHTYCYLHIDFLSYNFIYFILNSDFLSEAFRVFKHNFFFFSIWTPYSCLFAPARIFSTMLNRSDETGHSCLVSNHKVKSVNILPLRMMSVVDLSYMNILLLEYIPSVLR